MLGCENAGPCLPTYSSVHFMYSVLGTHGNYGFAYFKNQEPERGLFVQWQRTFQACFSLRKAEMKSGFWSSVVFKRLCRQTASHHLHHSLSLILCRGKPRMEHKNASLCLVVCVSLCLVVYFSYYVCLSVHLCLWVCMFTRETGWAREKRTKRKEKLNVLKLIPSVSCC